MKRVWSTYPALLALIILAATLTGCRKGPLPGDDQAAIRFSAGAAVISSATDSKVAVVEHLSTRDSLIKVGKQVAVYGSWAASASVPNNAVTPVFSDETLTCTEVSGDVSTWTYAPTRYWNHSGVYDFRAVFPARVPNVQGQPSRNHSGNGRQLVVDYSMHVDNYDMMVAHRRVTIGNAAPGTVDLSFKHAMSAICFQFINGSGDPPSERYFLHAFETQNLRTVGLLQYQLEGDEDALLWQTSEARAPQVWEWAAATPEESFEVTNDFDGLWYYAIPQGMLSDDGLHPAIKFSFSVNSKTADKIETTLLLPETMTENNATTEVVWETGKKYKYTIRIQPNHTDITLQVRPWDKSFALVNDIVL